MNIYRCHLNTGDAMLDAVTPIIVAETRGKAKAMLLWAASEAGYECDWTTPVSIRLEEKDVPEPEGILKYV